MKGVKQVVWSERIYKSRIKPYHKTGKPKIEQSFDSMVIMNLACTLL